MYRELDERLIMGKKQTFGENVSSERALETEYTSGSRDATFAQLKGL